MRFTRDDVRKELVARMTANKESLNLSERSFNEMLDTLIPLVANEEMELADFADKVLPTFKSANANVRNDVSVGIREYQEKNPIQKQEKVEPKIDEVWEERFKALETKLANAEHEKYVSNTKQEIISRLQAKGVKDKSWAEAMLDEITITNDFDIDAKVEAYLNIYNKVQSATPPNITPRGGEGGKPDYTSEVIKQAAALVKQNNLGD